MRPFIISTESNTDLGKQYLQENDITVITHYYSVNDVIYDDDNPLPLGEFYQYMREGGMPSTMASNPAVILEKFQKLVEDGYDILHISFSSELSGGYGNICAGAREIMEEHPEARIEVFDTLNASLGEGILLKKAVDMKNEGKSMDEILQWLEQNRDKVNVLFTVDDLNHLHRGGRVSKATAIIGGIVNVKPLLTVTNEGKLVSSGTVRGRKRSLNALVDFAQEHLGDQRDDIYMIGILHGDCLSDAEYVANQCKERFDTNCVEIHDIEPSIGAHTGPGTVGIAFFGSNRG